MWTPTPPLLGRRTPRLGLARVCVRAPLGRVGRAGLLGAFWCASPSPVAALCALLVCSAPSGLGLPCLWLFSVFCLVVPPLSLSFRVLQPGLPLALASCGPPAPPLPSFLFVLFPSPPPALSFFPSCFLFVCCPFFLFFCLPWCAGPAVFGLVCVSRAVGCAGVCCCGPCAPAGAVLRLCYVIGCSLVVPVPCVLLPVLRRCRGVFCVLPGAVW